MKKEVLCKELQALKKECIALGIPPSILKKRHNNLVLNCVDHQLISFEEGKFVFHTIHGSVCSYLETFDINHIHECAEFMQKISSRTADELNSMMERLWSRIKSN